MASDTIQEAWVRIPTEEERKKQMGDQPTGSYSFGFIPAMGRLLASHERIGPAFSALFSEIMRGPGFLTFQEREMIATVAAAAQDCYY